MLTFIYDGNIISYIHPLFSGMQLGHKQGLSVIPL